MEPNQPGGVSSAPPSVEHCYRHPDVQTGVHCTRCGRPICTRCMIPAPVGYQCPECVDDARREFRRGPGRRRFRIRALSATKVLLAVIAAMFVVEVVRGGPGSLLWGPSERTLVQLGAMQPLFVADGQYWRLFSSMFLHAGLIHIGFNAYALWLFGTLVDDDYGTERLVILFFVTGFVAGATSYALGPANVVAVGASGAIAGIFGAFIAYHWRRRSAALSAAKVQSAILTIVINVAIAVRFTQIDWRAHLGGLLAGIVAGYALDGFGSRTTRRVVAVAGTAMVVAVGIALVVWRTEQLRSLPGFDRLLGG